MHILIHFMTDNNKQFSFEEGSKTWVDFLRYPISLVIHYCNEVLSNAAKSPANQLSEPLTCKQAYRSMVSLSYTEIRQGQLYYAIESSWNTIQCHWNSTYNNILPSDNSLPFSHTPGARRFEVIFLANITVMALWRQSIYLENNKFHFSIFFSFIECFTNTALINFYCCGYVYIHSVPKVPKLIAATWVCMHTPCAVVHCGIGRGCVATLCTP